MKKISVAVILCLTLILSGCNKQDTNHEGTYNENVTENEIVNETTNEDKTSTNVEQADGPSEDNDSSMPDGQLEEPIDEEALKEANERIEVYQQLSSDIKLLTASYLDDKGEFTSKDELKKASDEVYAYGQSIIGQGKVTAVVQDISGSVTFTLDSGAKYLYAPALSGTCSGGDADDFSIYTFNNVGFWETVPETLAFHNVKGVEACGEYMENKFEFCTDTKENNYNHSTVDDVIHCLSNLSEDNCRIIFWRGHGNLSDNGNVYMLNEEINPTTEAKYAQDIKNGVIISGSDNYWITSAFMDKYMDEVDHGGLFFCGSCYSACGNYSMAKSITQKGFETYVGTSDTIINIYSDSIMYSVARYLCMDETKKNSFLYDNSIVRTVEERMNKYEELLSKITRKDAINLTTISTMDALNWAIEDDGMTDDDSLPMHVIAQIAYNIEDVEGSAYEDIKNQELGAYFIVLNRDGDPGFRVVSNTATNNGGTVVGLNDDVYYWKYTTDSIENTGVFVNFSPRTDVSNTLVCRHADGTEDILLKGPGSGSIYIYGGRLFTQKDYMTMYVMDLDGKNKTELSQIQICGLCENSGKLIVRKDYQYYAVLDCVTLKTTSLTESEWNYFGNDKNNAYFYKSDLDNEILYI